METISTEIHHPRHLELSGGEDAKSWNGKWVKDKSARNKDKEKGEMGRKGKKRGWSKEGGKQIYD